MPDAAQPNPLPHYATEKVTWQEPLGQGSGGGGLSESHKWLLKRRPRYEADCRFWQFLRQSYLGGPAWINGRNLPPHLVEVKQINDQLQRLQAKDTATPSSGASSFQTRAEYDLRLEQAFRAVNIMKEIINPLLGILAGHEPTIAKTLVTPGLKDFINGADYTEENTLSELTHEAIEWANVLGVYYIGIDGTLTPDELKAAIAGVEKDSQGRVPATTVPQNRPFAWLIDPSAVLNGKFEHRKSRMFDEVLLAEMRDNGKSLADGNCSEMTFRFWTKEKWEVWQIKEKSQGGTGDAEIIEEGINKLGIVPVIQVIVWKNEDDQWRGLSIGEDEVFTDRALASTSSSLFFSLDNDSDTQVFVSADLSELDDDEDKRNEFVAQMRESLRSRFGVFHRTIEPDVLNKESAQKGLMLESWERVYTTVLRLKGLGDKVDGNAGESGLAKIRRFQYVNAILSVMSKAQARAMRSTLELASWFLGGEPSMKAVRDLKHSAVVPIRNFDIRSLDDLLLMFEKMSGKVPPEWEKELILEIWKRYFGERSDEFWNKMQAALDKWVVPGSAASLMDGLIGNARPGLPPAFPPSPSGSVPGKPDPETDENGDPTQDQPDDTKGKMPMEGKAPGGGQ